MIPFPTKEKGMLSNTYSLGVFVFCLFVVLLFCFYIWMEQLFKRIPRNTLYISLTAFVLTVYCAFFLLMPDQLAKDIKTVEIERRSSFEALKQPVPPPTWSALGSGVDGRVNAITFDSAGNLYAGGDFTHAGGVTANHIAKWNGSSWSALGSGVNDYVLAINCNSAGNLYIGGVFNQEKNLYLGGDFNQERGAPANYITKWNGSSWSALGNGVNGSVATIAFDSAGNLYAGGEFTQAGGAPTNYIAKWNGSSWSALGRGVDGRVNAIAFDSARNLYAGGEFTQAGGVSAEYIAKWNGSSWSALGSWVNGTVDTIAFDSAGNLYAGENFLQAAGAPTNYIAKWNGSSWSAIADIGGVVDVFYFDKQGNLYVGGDFYVIDKKGKNNVKIKNIAKLGFK